MVAPNPDFVHTSRGQDPPFVKSVGLLAKCSAGLVSEVRKAGSKHEPAKDSTNGRSSPKLESWNRVHSSDFIGNRLFISKGIFSRIGTDGQHVIEGGVDFS